jgi:pimeloyl-ACP methyl ester carboxylesterase
VIRRISLLILLLAGGAVAYPPGPQVLTFFSEVDDSDQPYAIYLPKSFDPAKTYPLVVSLHGAWSNHRLNLKRVFGLGNRDGESDAEATRYWPTIPPVEFIVAAPYARGTMGYGLFAESDVWAMLADVKRRFRIDEDRVYLTGLSMGGGGTLSLALARPDVFAAIAPVCPAVLGNERNKVMNALNLPSWFHHGEKDPVVNVSVSRDFVFRLKYIGAPVEYTEYPGVAHNSWENAYRDGQIFAWFAKHKRNRYPTHVRFATDSYRYDRAYWVRFTGFTPGQGSLIDAVFAAPNEINFLSDNLNGVAFELTGHPQYDAAKPLLVRADGGELTIPPGQPAAVRKNEKGEWEVGAGTPAPGEKEPGFEGPIGAAFLGRHLYVYGTRDNPDAAELRKRRQEAERAANWDSPNLRLHYSPRVVADKDVRETDLKEGSLILFGTAETNMQIEAFGARAPLALKAGVKDHGLIFVIPGEAPGRYVVINSGLPFTTTGGLTMPGFLPLQPLVLGRAPDFALFKGAVQNIVSAGRFDNQWQIPAADKKKLRDSGVVELR